MRKGNEAYEQTKKGITLTRDMTIDILDKIALAVFEVKAYPDQDQIEDEDDGTSPSLKRAKRGEINHVPDHPENYNDDSLEDERLLLVEEFKKKNKNAPLIRQKMELTFSLRRREMVELQPMVSEVLERWPALFCEAEVSR